MPVTQLLEDRLELELWKRKLKDGYNPGDRTVHYLLAQIGYVLESMFSSNPVNQKRWFFWEKGSEMDISEENQEEWQAEDRQAILDMMKK